MKDLCGGSRPRASKSTWSRLAIIRPASLAMWLRTSIDTWIYKLKEFGENQGDHPLPNRIKFRFSFIWSHSLDTCLSFHFLTPSVFTVNLFSTILDYFFHTAWLQYYFLNVQPPRESTYFNIVVIYCCYFIRVEVQEKRREGQERKGRSKKHVWHQNMPQMWKGKLPSDWQFIRRREDHKELPSA